MQEPDKRPKPEDFLKQIDIEETESNKRNLSHNGNKRGKLKIFLGYCAGVGKTYRMLEEANSAKQHGIDVIIAIAETHGRKETEFLLQGLEIIQKKKSEYKELFLEEMDLDAVLKRHPQLAIVDELAHTNSPGSRHAKRYQDVEELLNEGIDVYTTLNIQHVESIIDVVYQITLVKVQESVPDRIIELADEIELVDLAPEKLLERLRDGKVYIPQKAQTAMHKFFARGNLLALRELALRYTAKRVDEDILSYKTSHAILTPWPAGSRLLVAISSSPSSENLIRMADRMATDLSAEWYAVHIDSPQQVQLNEAAQNQLNSNIRLAEELGAHVFALSGTAIAKEILNFAKQKNITLILAGFSQRSKFDEIFKGSILNDLIKESVRTNILIVSSENYQKESKQKSQFSTKTDYKPYLLSALSIAVTVTIGILLSFWTTPGMSGMLLLIPAIASSLIWGNKVGLFASLIAMASLDFFFIAPFYTFKITDTRYFPIFIVFIVVFLIISSLAKLIKWQSESTRRRERFLSSLYSFNREMMISKTYLDILNRAARYISEAFESHVVILLPDENENLDIKTETNKKITLNENERAAATWVYKNGLPAGKNTNTLASLPWYYLPLVVQDKTIGVIALTPMDKANKLSPEQNRLLESFANLVALTLYKTLS